MNSLALIYKTAQKRRNDADKKRMGYFSKNYVNRPISNSYWEKTSLSCMVYPKMVALFQIIRRDETTKFKRSAVEE